MVAEEIYRSKKRNRESTEQTKKHLSSSLAANLVARNHGQNNGSLHLQIVVDQPVDLLHHHSEVSAICNY